MSDWIHEWQLCPVSEYEVDTSQSKPPGPVIWTYEIMMSLSMMSSCQHEVREQPYDGCSKICHICLLQDTITAPGIKLIFHLFV